ncbi:MAG: GntR family transcriptional regulator [Elusimicrobiota bacterium]
MIRIDTDSPVPIYDQIKAGLRGLVTRGALRPGDQAPSIRTLALDLKVNPNTVARAFRELVLEGFLESRRGGGNFIAQEARHRAKVGLKEVKDSLREALTMAKRGGLNWKDIEEVVRESKGAES